MYRKEQAAAKREISSCIMSEFLRKYWFVCLVAVLMIGGLIYYIADLNKDNVSSKTADGKDVVATTTLGDVDSSTIFDKYQTFNQSLLYNMYRNAVVDQSMEATSAMKSEAKSMRKTIETNMDADTTGKTRLSIISELAGYGFEGEESLEDYCLMSIKQRELNREYVKDHLDELKDSITTSPRAVSIIKVDTPNAEILSEEVQTKKDNIDKALENGDDFASVATSFSDDTTAANGGVFGYIDSSTTTLDTQLVSAAAELAKGETSEWITVTDEDAGTSALYLIHVDEDDIEALLNSDNTDISNGMLYAIINANSGLETTIVESYAKSLEITFENDAVKSQVENYIKNQTGGEEE